MTFKETVIANKIMNKSEAVLNIVMAVIGLKINTTVLMSKKITLLLMRYSFYTAVL